MGKLDSGSGLPEPDRDRFHAARKERILTHASSPCRPRLRKPMPFLENRTLFLHTMSSEIVSCSAVGWPILQSKGSTMKILTWSAVGRLLGVPSGFMGFYLVAFTFFPPESEIDSMALMIPFFLSACVFAIIGGWLGGDLFDQFGRACRRRQQRQAATQAEET